MLALQRDATSVDVVDLRNPQQNAIRIVCRRRDSGAFLLTGGIQWCDPVSVADPLAYCDAYPAPDAEPAAVEQPSLALITSAGLEVHRIHPARGLARYSKTHGKAISRFWALPERCFVLTAQERRPAVADMRGYFLNEAAADADLRATPHCRLTQGPWEGIARACAAARGRSGEGTAAPFSVPPLKSVAVLVPTPRFTLPLPLPDAEVLPCLLYGQLHVAHVAHWPQSAGGVAASLGHGALGSGVEVVVFRVRRDCAARVSRLPIHSPGTYVLGALDSLLCVHNCTAGVSTLVDVACETSARDVDEEVEALSPASWEDQFPPASAIRNATGLLARRARRTRRQLSRSSGATVGATARALRIGGSGMANPGAVGPGHTWSPLAGPLPLGVSARPDQRDGRGVDPEPSPVYERAWLRMHDAVWLDLESRDVGQLVPAEVGGGGGAEPPRSPMPAPRRGWSPLDADSPGTAEPAAEAAEAASPSRAGGGEEVTGAPPTPRAARARAYRLTLDLRAFSVAAGDPLQLAGFLCRRSRASGSPHSASSLLTALLRRLATERAPFSVLARLFQSINRFYARAFMERAAFAGTTPGQSQRQTASGSGLPEQSKGCGAQSESEAGQNAAAPPPPPPAAAAAAAVAARIPSGAAASAVTSFVRGPIARSGPMAQPPAFPVVPWPSVGPALALVGDAGTGGPAPSPGASNDGTSPAEGLVAETAESGEAAQRVEAPGPPLSASGFVDTDMAILLQSSMCADVFARLRGAAPNASASLPPATAGHHADLNHVAALVAEYARSLHRLQVPVQPQVHVELARSLVAAGDHESLQRLLQYHVLQDSARVAAELLRTATGAAPKRSRLAARQLVYDILHRLRMWHVIVADLARRGLALQAARVACERRRYVTPAVVNPWLLLHAGVRQCLARASTAPLYSLHHAMREWTPELLFRPAQRAPTRAGAASAAAAPGPAPGGDTSAGVGGTAPADDLRNGGGERSGGAGDGGPDAVPQTGPDAGSPVFSRQDSATAMDSASMAVDSLGASVSTADPVLPAPDDRSYSPVARVSEAGPGGKASPPAPPSPALRELVVGASAADRAVRHALDAKVRTLDPLEPVGARQSMREVVQAAEGEGGQREEVARAVRSVLAGLFLVRL